MWKHLKPVHKFHAKQVSLRTFLPFVMGRGELSCEGK